jgi:putative peptide modification system cyclase
MQRQPTALLDRAVASEVAVRDGARAVILPTVAEVGGRVRVSAEVIDPHTQTTVYAESADGVGAESALDSIDKVTGELREKLGEAIAAIERDSEPLPKVSTNNLDALKAYALGRKKFNVGEVKQALGYYQRAIELDPDFALARMASAKVYGILLDQPSKHGELAKAARFRNHLTAREQLLLDAELARSGPILPQLDRWRQLVDLYPDSYPERVTLAQDGLFYANRFDDSLAQAQASTIPQYEGMGIALYLKGIIQVGMDRLPDAIKSFEASRKAGFQGEGVYYAYAYAAQRDFDTARKLLSSAKPTGVQTADLDTAYGQMLVAADEGRFDESARIAEESRKLALAREPLIVGGEWRSRALSAELLAERMDKAQASRRLLEEIAQAEANAQHTDALYAGFSEAMVLGLGYMGARIDSAEVVQRALAAVEKSKDVAVYPFFAQMQQILLAEQDRIAGNADAAIDRLTPIARRNDGLIASHAALLRAARKAGNDSLALEEAKWLTAHRGRAYVEGNAAGLPVVLNLADINLADLQAAEIHAARGNSRLASDALRRFTLAWPLEAMPPTLRRRVAAQGG